MRDTAIVTLSKGHWYTLLTPRQESVQARLRGKLKLQGWDTTNPVVVGDEVEYCQEGGDYLITGVLPRRNYIIRKSVNLSKKAQIIASNIDQALLLITLHSPQTSRLFVDRFLVACESFRIPVVLVFNKCDLYTPQELEEVEIWRNLYAKIGYESEVISTLAQTDIQKIRVLLQDKTSVMGGHSGVGKSSLINCLDPAVRQKIGEISNAHKAGKHTTTYAQLFTLEFGARLIDTPGIRGFGFFDLPKSTLSHYFPEMRALLGQCRFSNCQHLAEPDCAVQAAALRGEIDPVRWENYNSLMLQQDETAYRKNDYSE